MNKPRAACTRPALGTCRSSTHRYHHTHTPTHTYTTTHTLTLPASPPGTTPLLFQCVDYLLLPLVYMGLPSPPALLFGLCPLVGVTHARHRAVPQPNRRWKSFQTYSPGFCQFDLPGRQLPTLVGGRAAYYSRWCTRWTRDSLTFVNRFILVHSGLFLAGLLPGSGSTTFAVLIRQLCHRTHSIN